MKTFLSKTFLFLAVAFGLIFKSNVSKADLFPAEEFSTSFNIDMYDTVVFDISQSQMNGNVVSFPVYIQTDDTINALDFSVSFSGTDFLLDTIINLTAYLQPFYNMNMSTLYFTSYSLQEIEHNVPLISIQLDMLSHYLCSSDLTGILVYLNGETCSVKVIECLTDATPEHVNATQSFDVYPNPADDRIIVELDAPALVQLIDLKSSEVVIQENAGQAVKVQINTSACAAGIYLVRIISPEGVTTRKVAVN